MNANGAGATTMGGGSSMNVNNLNKNNKNTTNDPECRLDYVVSSNTQLSPYLKFHVLINSWKCYI